MEWRNLRESNEKNPETFVLHCTDCCQRICDAASSSRVFMVGEVEEVTVERTVVRSVDTSFDFRSQKYSFCECSYHSRNTVEVNVRVMSIKRQRALSTHNHLVYTIFDVEKRRSPPLLPLHVPIFGSSHLILFY